MKSITHLCVLVLLLSSTTCFAQFPLSKTKSKFSGIRGTIGGYTDTYDNLTPQGMLSLIKSGQNYDFDLANYDQQDSYGAIMSGGNIGFEAVFNPFKTDGSSNLNQEIRVGASANIAREAMIDVWQNSPQDPNDLSYYPDYNTVTLCIIENEFLLQSSYIFRAPYLDGLLDVYGGPSVNIGTTFGNEFIFLGGPEQTLEARNSSYFRGSAVFGGSINLKRFSYQMEGALGLGAQAIHGGGSNTLKTSGFKFALAYRFNQ